MFVILLEDHHTDVKPYIRKTKQEAYDFAIDLAHEECCFCEDYMEFWEDGKLKRIKYSCEGDQVSVHEVD